MHVPFTPPTKSGDLFNCPYCNAFATQSWHPVVTHLKTGLKQDTGVSLSCCLNCREYAIWLDNRLVVPPGGSAPMPNPDMAEDVKRDYNEAREILNLSPRGAAALLRLAIQKLCANLGQPGKNINDDIAALVKGGLPAQIQQALDIVRVVGNNAVHPGQIDLRDDTDTAAKLFGLVNVIVQVMVTQPKHISELYSNVVPRSQQEAIARRDGQK